MTAMRDVPSLNTEVDSLWANFNLLADRVRHVEKMLDTRATPLWKRVIFRIDGWPSWTVVADQPRWRPWRKWWRS
jgi:hypothetical protein